MELTYTIRPDQAGRTVLTILRREMSFSATLVRRLKNANAISVNGHPVYTNFVLSAGDMIRADISSAEPSCDIVPEDGAIDILFENDGILAVNKPSGLIVHPSHARYTGTLANFVAGYLKSTCGDFRCHAINRLDRDTSGIVLFAKNGHIKDLVSKSLNSDEALKEYVALVYGIPNPSCGTVDKPIKRLTEGQLLRVVSPDGQRAVTNYETLKSIEMPETGEVISLLRFELETGRTHQIRVHSLYMETPILGDILYRTEKSLALSDSLKLTKQALHAWRITFRDPLSNELITLTAPIKRNDFFGETANQILKA